MLNFAFQTISLLSQNYTTSNLLAMNILRNIGIAVLVIIGIALVGVYFLPNSYTVSRSIEIDRTPDEVLSRITNYNTWSDWSPWYEQEPTAQQTFEGNAGQAGHKMSWKGEKLGEGALTLESASVTNGVVARLEFIKPFKSKADDIWLLEKTSAGTKLTWVSKGELGYPVGRLFGLSVEGMLGTDKEKGLAKLKNVLELPKKAEVIVPLDSVVKQEQSVTAL